MPRRLREIALPFMQDVHGRSKENTRFAVRNGHDALYIAKLTGHQAVPIISREGSRLPTHPTGVGVVHSVRGNLTRYAPELKAEAAEIARAMNEHRLDPHPGFVHGLPDWVWSRRSTTRRTPAWTRSRPVPSRTSCGPTGP